MRWYHIEHTVRCTILSTVLSTKSPNPVEPLTERLEQVVKSRIQGATHVPGVVPKYNWSYPAYVASSFEVPSPLF